MTKYIKLLRCILSCETKDQMKVTRELINKVYDQLTAEENFKLNIIFKIKEYNDMALEVNDYFKLANDIYQLGEYEFSVSLTNIAHEIIDEYETTRKND